MSFIQRITAEFVRVIVSEVMKVYGLNNPRSEIMQKNILRWSLGVGKTFYKQMTMLEMKAAFSKFGQVRKFAGFPATIKQFYEIYRQEVQSLSSVDLTTATMISRNLYKRFKKNASAFYAEYETYSKLNLGKSLSVIKKEFLETATGRDALSFIDKAGREWNPSAYADMYCRTRTAEISNDVFQSEMDELGMDVIQITEVNDTCPMCQMYNGKYFSLRGETEGLPQIDAYPPFHPNCFHDMIVVSDKEGKIEGYLKQNEKLDRQIRSDKANWTESEKRQVQRHLHWNEVNRVK